MLRVHNGVEKPTAHSTSATQTKVLQGNGVLIAQTMDNERKADDLFAMNADDTAVPCAPVTGQFKRGVHAKGSELAACGLKKWLG